MKLFISYSREDKSWVYELWRALRDRAHHDVWIDQWIVPAQDWWATILQNIEVCECFLYVMTPQSVESIYCRAELAYALALNKPILPLLLKDTELPADLKRIQFLTVTNESNWGDVLFVIASALAEVRVDALQGKYPAQSAKPPSEPIPQQKLEEASEVFMLAEEAAHTNNFTLAAKLFQQVIGVDPHGVGLAAAERLGEIEIEHRREDDYANLFEMFKNPVLAKGVRALAKVYVQRYGIDYDPQTILPTLLEGTTPFAIPATPKESAGELSTGIQRLDNHGVLMVYVPATTHNLSWNFHMGANDIEVARPAHSVTIPNSYWLDLTPVTNESYAQFAREGYSTRDFWTAAGWEWAQKYRAPHDYRSLTAPKQPRVGVTWYEAYAYCQWRGGRLPTEAEWEWAARGPENRSFPWGSQFESAKAIHGVNSEGKTAVVGEGIREAGASWVGALDLCGNVWEWTNTIYLSYPYTVDDGREDNEDATRARVLRGGSWLNNEALLRSANRLKLDPVGKLTNLGFRCARSSAT
ncbi:MAG: SUMF1/EgtB/PvdO family nonheme iron enzyme [Anaerolineae bacterium]|nr:SUMF1/EgtB/PvdO family nonheme iron enzyme [Anaerolineae bacterium]